MQVALEQPSNVCFCETCAERGRPKEPVYKMGMCEFCYRGLPHPKATPEELLRERLGGHERHLPLKFHRALSLGAEAISRFDPEMGVFINDRRLSSRTLMP